MKFQIPRFVTLIAILGTLTANLPAEKLEESEDVVIFSGKSVVDYTTKKICVGR